MMIKQGIAIREEKKKKGRSKEGILDNISSPGGCATSLFLPFHIRNGPCAYDSNTIPLYTHLSSRRRPINHMYILDYPLRFPNQG